MIDPVYERHLASLQTSLTTLPDKPEEDAENTLRSLWFAAHGLPVSVELAVARDLPTLNENEYEKLENLVRQRLQGTPLAHLTGRQRFMDLELLAGPEALIPRKETELLARGALAVVKEIVAAQGKAVVVDVCTGSGNIACTIAHYEPNAMVYAADVSPEAVGLAQRNARHIGVHERVTFREGDLLKPFEADPGFGNVDVVTCNPPYIGRQAGRIRRRPAAQEAPAGVGRL